MLNYAVKVEHMESNNLILCNENYYATKISYYTQGFYLF